MGSTFYSQDVAYIHHVGYRGHPLSAAPWLLRTLRRAGLRGGTLVDLGCGSGLWAREAAREGFKVIGIDISPAMVRLAKSIAPGASFHCMPLDQFQFPRCDVVTALGEV